MADFSTPIANRQVTVDGGTLQVGGIVQAGAFGITKLGAGALTLSGANLNTGPFVLSAGKVNVNAAAALGAATATVALNGGTIDNTSGLLVTSTAAGLMTFGGNVVFGASATAPLSASLTLPGAVTLTSDRNITVNAPGMGLVANGSNLASLTGIISANFQLTKLGKGTLLLNGVNTFGGATKLVTLSEGTLSFGNSAALGNVANTLVISAAPGAAVAVDSNAPIGLNANPWTIGSDFAYLGSSAGLNNQGATVALGAATRTITLMGNATNRLTFGGVISADPGVGLTANGIGFLDFFGASSYDGATTINAGTTLSLGMNNGVANAAGSISSTTLVLNGGTLAYTRTGAVSQSFAGGTTIGSGAATISESLAASQTLNLGALGRTNGGTVNFSITGAPAGTTGITTSTTNTAGILGGWATLGGLNWAVGNGATSSITAFAAYTPSTAPTTAPGTGTNVDFQASNSTPWTTQDVNSLAFRTAGATTLTLTAANILTLDSGGILVNSTVAGNASTITGGTIATTGDLILTNFATSGTLNINSVISAAGLTKSGTSTGAAIIGGTTGNITNSLTGTVTVNAGVLQVNSTSATGGNGATGALNSLPITLNGGTLSLRFDDNTGSGSQAAIAATNAVTVNGNATILVDRLAAANPIGSTTFTTPLNKTIQFSTLAFGNDGRTLTVTPSNGYGLEFTGTTTLDKNLTTINVGTATGSNVVQGLTLSGQVTGTIAGGSWTKAGAGTVVLNNATNNFTSNMVLSAGALAFNSDAALGNAANTITLTGANVAVLRAYGGTAATPLSIATARTINLWGSTTANNVIEVTDNTTLTLNSAFGGGNSPFTKSDLGTLILNADNGIWAGQVSIASGALRVTNSGALGISTSATAGNTVVAGTGGALQLSGVSIWDQLNLTGSGISTGGALQALSGTTNTANGLITLGGAAPAIGAESTATLNIRGGISGAQALTFAGAGTINVDTNAIAAISSITKIGNGTTTLGVASPTFVGAITVNAGTLALGGSIGAGAGSVGGSGAIAINPGGTLTVDNSVGTGLDNRLSSGGTLRAITLSGGNFNYVGNANTPSFENLGVPTFNRGESTITVTAGANAGAGLILGTPAFNTGITALFRGSNLGSAPGNGVATIASNFTFTGAGAAGTITKGILPWALVDASAAGTGTSFATADTATGNLRALASSEYVTTLGGLVSSANIVLGAADRLAGSSTINSLTLTSTGTAAFNPLQTLTVGGGANLGGILNTVVTTISGGLLTSGGGGGVVFHANADLTLDSVLVGSAGGSPAYLTKTGAGILTLNKANAFIGQTAINQGTLKLAAGNNTLFYSSGSSFLAINGTGTLDLNGNSQQVQGLFSDGAYSTPTATITGGAGSTLVTNSDARNWGGVIAGSVAFQRGGSASTTTFYSDNTYSGATLISGGTIALQDAGKLSLSPTIGIDFGGVLSVRNDLGTLNDNNRLKDDAAITLRGGVFQYLGRAATNSTERAGVLTIAAGFNSVDVRAGGTAVNSAEMTFTSLDHTNSTGIVNFAQANGNPSNNGLIGNAGRIFFDTPPTVPASGLIGGWAIVSRDFAAYNSTLGVAALNSAGYAGYSRTSLTGSTSTDNVKITNTATTLAGDTTTNTLNLTYNSLATGTLALGGSKLTLTGGGLIMATPNDGAFGVISNGTLTAGTGSAAADLYVNFLPYSNSGTARSLSISAAVIDNTVSGPVRLVVSSSDASSNTNNITLSGVNLHTGGTVINGGRVNLVGAPATVVIPNATIPASGLIINAADVTMLTNGGQIGSSNIVSLNGNSTLTLAGTNSLAGLVFNVDGGAGTGSTVATRASALTLTGGITAGGSNPNALATISGAGGLNLNGNATYSMVVNPFTFNSQNVAPLSATLSITTAITNGGIVKTGDGLLSLGAANTFNSGVDLAAGGIAIANNGALGTVGSSTLTISGNNTTLTADATGGRVVANNVILGNSATTINLGNYNTGTLTLSGPTTWSTATGVARTLNVNAVTGGGVTINTQTLSGVITSAGTGNGIVKTGIGTLAITGNNTATLDWTGSNAVTVNNGLLQINADTALGAIPGAAVADNILLNGGGLSASAPYTLNVNRGISLGATNGVIDTSFAVTIPGTVGGAGSLVKSGTGALTLSGVNSFTGGVFANAGTLNFTNATAPTFTGLSVAGGAALNMLNGVGQAYNLGSGSLNLGAGTGAASLGLEMLNPTTNDSFTTAGAALTANTVILNMTRLSGATGGTFTLLSAASGLNNANYVFNPAGWALSASTVSATSVQVTATPVTGDLFWAGAVNLSWGGLNGSFDSNFSTDLAGTNAKSTPGFDQGLTFSANGLTATTLSTTLDINSSIRDLTFSNNVGSGPLGTINIAPGVGGTLSITPAVSTAGINVQAGAPAAINISAPVTLGANQTWSVADAATVLNVSGNITGTANLIKAGSGILQLGGTNTYIGTTTVSNGVLRAGATNGLNAGSAFTVGATGTLRLNGFSATVGSLAGSAGAIVENNSATSGIILTTGADNSTTTYAGVIQNGAAVGTLGLTKQGTGTLTLTGTNTYTGLTTVDAGTLALSANTTTTAGQYLIANAANSKGIMTISTGTSLTSTVGAGSAMRIGVGANSVGVVTQNGGSVTLGTVANNYNLALGGDGGTSNSANTNFNFGAYNLNGGTAKAFQTEVGDSGGTGMMTITDGTFGDAAGARHFIIGRFGNSVGVVSLMGTGGATPTLIGALATGGVGMGWSDASNNNRSELNVGNLGLVDAGAATNGILWRANGSNNVGIVNLLTGGTIQAGTLTNNTGTSTSIVNLNGGTLRSTQSTATFMTNLTSVNVYSGGAIIDTNGFNNTVQALLAPIGNGVTLTGGTGSGYLAAPYVKITGDGVGATAIATIDGSGNITGFTLTNPGVGYTNATVTLVGGGGTGTAPTAGFVANTSGGLRKDGAGVLTLTGANTYTGLTNVTAGTLIVNNTLASTAVTVANTATLGGTGTLTSSLVTVNSGGTLSAATSTTGGTLTMSSLTLDAGSLLAYEFGGTPDLVAVTTASGLTINGGALSLYATGGVSPLTTNGTYNLFNYTTGFGGALTNLTVANSQAGKTYAIFDNVGVSIQLVLGTATSADWSGTIDGLWTNDGAGNNWNGGAQPNSLGAVANFGNLALTPQTVTLNGGKTVGSILFNNTNSFTIGTNTDAITLDNGIAASAISATLGNHVINAPIALNGPANITPGTGTKITFGGAISGTGKSLTFSGAGTSELNVANSYSGGTILTAGTLNLGHDNALGTGALTITGGTIDNTKGSLLSNTTNNNAQNWNGSFTFTGTDSMDLGTGAVTLGATSTITTSGTAAKILTVGGAIDDGALSAGLTKAGTGTLVLNGNNGYDGVTTMNAGVLTLAGNNSGASGGVTLTAGTLNINNDNALGSGRLTLGSGTFDTNANRTVAGNILQTWSNAATAVFTGTNTLNLGTGAVTLGTDATTGSFTLTNNSALPGTSLTVGGNITAIAGGTAGVKTLTIAGAGSTALTGNITRGAASNAVVTVTSPGTTTLSGAASLINTLNVNGGATSIIDLGTGILTINNGGNSGIQSSTGGIINATGGGSLALGVSGDNNGTANGTTLTINAPITGAFQYESFVVGSGTGIVVLANPANSFTGGVFINSGVISVASIGNSGNNSPLGTNGTISFATSNNSTLMYTGNGENTNKIISLAGTTIGGTLDQSGPSGNLNITGNFALPGAGIKTLFLQGSTVGTGQISGAIINNSGTNTTGVTKAGTGLWNLSGANLYTGATTVSGGTLQINGSYAVAGGGTTSQLQVGSGAGTNGTVIIGSGAGTVTFGGDGFTNAAQVGVSGGTGALTINGGTVNLLGTTGTASTSLHIGGQVVTAAGTGTVTVNGGILNVGQRILMGFNNATSNGTLTIAGGTVNVGTNGTLGYTGNNPGSVQFGSGTTTVNLNGGNLKLNGFKSTSATNTINFNGGTVTALGNQAFFIGNNGASDTAPSAIGTITTKVKVGGVIIDTNTFNITIGTALVEDGVSTGGGLTKSGAGTMTLSGANTYTGTTSVTGGILKAGVASVANVSGAFGNNSAVSLANTAGVSMDIIGFNTQIGSLTGGGAIGGNVTLGAATLTVGGDNTSPAAYAGVISSTGAGGLTKIGTGTQILSGDNTYTGVTNVNAGILRVNGNHTGGGDYTVASTGTLQGTGSTASALNVSGILSPGASIETFASGTLNMLAGSTFDYEVDSSVALGLGADLQKVTGGFNLTGLVNLSIGDAAVTDTAYANDTTFSLINYTGAWNNNLFTVGGNAIANAGTFTVGLNTWRLDYNSPTGGSNFTGEYAGGSDSFVNITVIPEPSSVALLGVLGSMILFRRRRVA